MRIGVIALLLLGACSGEEAAETAPPEEAAAEEAPRPPRGKAGAGGPPPQRPGFHAEVSFELVGEPQETLHDVLIISLDTVRADRLGVYGGRAETPALSALAARGARFDQAISHFPETALSHWAMLSGVLPVVHGNVPAHGGSLYPGPTVAEIAGEHGYTTGAVIGGVTLTDSASGLGRAFDHYDDDFEVDPLDMRRHGREVTEAALAWWAETPSPKLLFVHYFDAHFPYTPAAPWDTAYDPDYAGSLTGSDADLRPYRDGERQISERDLQHILALYDGELSEQDALVAPLLDAVADSPEVVVAVTSDHGESFEHDYYFNHRAGLWDGVTRVPWIMAGPMVPPGVRVADQVGLVDLAPTVLTLAGLPVDARMAGAARNGLFVQGIRTEGMTEVISVTDPWAEAPQRAVRTLQHKLIRWEDRHEAYDLAADPQETAPLSAHPKALDDALKAYERFTEGVGQLQVEAPASRLVDPEEAAQLEALGYLAPGQEGAPGQQGQGGPPPRGKARGTPPPRGKAPGRPPGTPPPER